MKSLIENTQAQDDRAKIEPVYDILNCGPRHRFWANGKLVHNSANMQNLPSGRREGQSDLLRRSIIAQGNSVIVNYDASQIECLDGRGRVLTQRGLVELRHVEPDDLLWDGVEWVKHDGVVIKGVKDVITYSGITATPDHVVYTRNGAAVLFGRAAAARIELMVGEVNGKEVYAAPLMRRYKPKPAVTPKDPTGRYDEWGNPITGTIEVFDIVNAGPRHRFTYNGLVVSNCRVLAYVANQTDVLGVFASGGDVYSFAASRIYGTPYEEITKGRKSSDPEEAHKYGMMRQYGKTATLACIAGDTEVLSNRGWVRMVDLRDDDLLWDGAAFVPHEGIIYKGEQECIDFNGVTMTPDHKVFDGHKWEEAQSADGTQCASYAERSLPAVV